MKIKEITLFTNQLEKQSAFFSETMGLDIIEKKDNKFSVQIGWTVLTFQKSNIDHKYHYCFLIPSNKLDESIEWLKKRLEIIKIEGNRIKQKFESWNAESVYFYDGSGNLAEFIVRYDLENNLENGFDLSQILCVNEIGMPTNDVEKINSVLEKELNSKFWKGNLNRFGTNGTQEGLFLLVNHELKKIWFPTELETEPSPFNATIEVNKKTYGIEFKKEKLKVFGNHK